MNHGQIAFDTSGHGNVPLLCVHGWACNGGQFAELSERLESDFRIFRLDLPGHGKTPLHDFKPGFESYARLIAEFVRAQRLERPVLLGHSMGGVLCLMAAASGDVQPRAVINVDGSLPAAASSAAAYPLLRAMLSQPDYREQFAKMARKTFFLEAERDARCEAIVRTMSSAPDAVLRFLPEQTPDLRPQEILPKVHAPVLYVSGVRPRFDLDKAASEVPRFTYEQIADAGHFLQVYAPNQLAAILGRFLANRDLR